MTQYNQMTKVSWFCDSGLKLSRMYKEYSKFVKCIAMWLIEYSKVDKVEKSCNSLTKGLTRM
jgi:hypothetical protein